MVFYLKDRLYPKNVCLMFMFERLTFIKNSNNNVFVFETQMQLEREKFVWSRLCRNFEGTDRARGPCSPPSYLWYQKVISDLGLCLWRSLWNNKPHHLWVDEYKWKYRIEIWYIHIDRMIYLLDMRQRCFSFRFLKNYYPLLNKQVSI